ncbi:molybdopterin/thiamine biosynthesis adenylyltransferase [Rhodanobacter sp. ANJX3]|uniref:ThiF family adenylyltransferase n=1 Tax=Rhodanobacter sp. ANJX3 TaxID=2723083 RepID=UPI00161B809F|nr:ThiF family adenylyltransferase [Rhodanobacter sp. ANJX3]MBB5356844.1 molybdopterin/thiamine biosynthesis adenylyltransferase [Rhodanobacter sp. ANJX3]
MRYLVAQGFTYVARRHGAVRFRGPLKCRQGPIQVDLSISDWDFISYPTIRLRDRPAALEGVQAHISASNGLCYYTQGSVVLDRYDPISAVAQCLAQATHVLDELALNPDYRRAELTREYLANWSVAQTPGPLPVVKAGVSVLSTHVRMAAIGARFLIFADDLQELEAISGALDESLTDYGSGAAWVLRTPQWPPMSQSFPKDVRSLFAWLKAWDKNLSGNFQNRLGHDREYLKRANLYLVVESPAGWLGVCVPLGSETTRLLGKRNPSAYRQYMHAKGKTQPVTRLSVIDWSAAFVHSRNLTFQDLTDKRITLIGCGAIGSHLAEALVRLGAGQGKRGRLRIIDPDLMGSENLGRHALGYPSLFQEKSIAMEHELKRTFPLAKVVGVVGNALAVSDLFEGDLVIDATGEEALSEAINARHLKAGAAAGPMLYVRISGTGGAVQSLWVDPEKGACFRCLRTNVPQGHRAERFPIEKSDDAVWVMKGCHAVTLYAVSAPMHAAALAADVVADWLKGDVSPRLRVVVRPGADVHPVKSQNPKRLENCPACSPVIAALRKAG